MIKGNKSDVADVLLYNVHKYYQRKSSKSFCFTLFERWYIAHNSVTGYPIVMGVASKCSMFPFQEVGVQISKLKIFDIRLISLAYETANSDKDG